MFTQKLTLKTLLTLKILLTLKTAGVLLSIRRLHTREFLTLKSAIFNVKIQPL